MPDRLKYPMYGPLPQTVAEAIEHGWDGLELRFWSCRPPCPRHAVLMFCSLANRGESSRPLAAVFANAICMTCGRQPDHAVLAERRPGLPAYRWRERGIAFLDGTVSEPGINTRPRARAPEARGRGEAPA